MAPPNFAYRLMREATLRLSVNDAQVRSLINPRQSSPITYVGSALNAAPAGEWANDLAAPGAPAPEALLQDGEGASHLSQRFGHGFLCLAFGGVGPDLSAVGVTTLDLPPGVDTLGQAWQRCGLRSADEAALVLVRPDGYVMGRWHGLDPAPLRAALKDTGVLA